MRKILGFALILSMFFGLNMLWISQSKAASLTSVTDVMSRLKTNTLANHEISFTTPTGVAAAGTITVTFPSDFAPEGGIDYTDLDLSANGSDITLAATPSGTTWGAVFGGTGNRTLTFTSDTGTIAASSAIVVKIGTNATGGDKQITNPTSADSYTISITCGASDSGSLAVAITDEDQVSISGSVSPYLQFAVTQGTVALGTLSRTSEKTATATMTAATNATSGYSITVNGNTLTSGANTITAIGGTATASTPGTKQFGLKVGAAGGSGSAVSPYNTANYAFDIDHLPSQVAQSATSSDTTTFTVTYLANISNTTAAGSYTATHTYICTGNF